MLFDRSRHVESVPALEAKCAFRQVAQERLGCGSTSLPVTAFAL
jgi:hypothetical protein